MPSPHLYVAAGVRLGHDINMLQRAAAYQLEITSNDAFPLLTLRHLVHQTQTDYGYLRKIVERRLDEYVPISRRKSDGTLRSISAPKPALMEVQRWILTNVLTGLRIHRASYAYRRGLSIKHCAEAHVGATWLLKMDLHNFFGTIDESRVYAALRGIGYPALLAFELARICTRIPPSGSSSKPKPWLQSRGVDAYGSSQRGVLPQGAPTSGAIANAVSHGLDVRLSDLARDSGLVYTRYSDDLTLSSPAPFNRRKAVKLLTHIERCIALSGFQVHRRKTRIVPPGSRQIILGLMLQSAQVRLMPEFRRQLDNHIRGVDKFGPASHAYSRQFDSTLSLINYVDGCLAFATDIEGEWSRARRGRWLAALAKHGHPVFRGF